MAVCFELRNALEKDKAVVADIERKIAECESELTRLKSSLQQYKARVKTQRRILKSRDQNFINRLVDEVLLNIFSNLAETEDEHPWFAASVCKRWRRVCLDNPILWSHFRVWNKGNGGHICGGTNLRNAAVALRTVLQLKRSRTAPLCVEVDGACQCALQLSTFQTIARQASRWKEFEFSGFCGTTGAQVLRDLIPPSAEFTLLQRLGLAANQPDEPSPTPKLPFDGIALPQIRSIELKNIVTLKGKPPQLPWGQLTTLHLCKSIFHTGDLLSILPQCQSLRSLKLDEVDEEFGDHVPSTNATQEAITLPHLVELYIVCSEGAGLITHIVPYLQLPSLRKLEIGDLSTLQTAVDLIERSSCGKILTHLNIYRTSPKQGIKLLPTLLQSCPNLDNLYYSDQNTDEPTITDIALNNRLIQGLTLEEGGGPVLCPRLRTLGVDLTFDPLLMMQMLESRMDHVSSCLTLAGVAYLPIVSGIDEEKSDEWKTCKLLLKERYRQGIINLTFGREDENED